VYLDALFALIWLPLSFLPVLNRKIESLVNKRYGKLMIGNHNGNSNPLERFFMLESNDQLKTTRMVQSAVILGRVAAILWRLQVDQF
jgi:hypothetical protein